MTRFKKVSVAFLALLLLAAGAGYFYGKSWLETTIRKQLEARGLTQLSFSLDHVGPTGIIFKDVALAGALPLSVDKITIDYSLPKLLQGDVKHVTIAQVKFENAGVKAEANNLTIVFAARDEQGAQNGTWAIEQLNLTHESLPVPPLAATGTWSAASSGAKFAGEAKSADGSYYASFALDQRAGDPEHSSLQLVQVRLPWQDGRVLISRANIPLQPGKAIRIPVQLDKVSLDAVMKAATGGRAEASGHVSGTVPVIIQNGGFSIGQGKLATPEKGVLKLSPEVIPGDNPQVQMVRDVLQDFHYSEFSMSFEPQKDDKLSILLSLGGNNPAVYNGREIKLNVQLTGDLLELLEQSILPTADPKQFLKAN